MSKEEKRDLMSSEGVAQAQTASAILNALIALQAIKEPLRTLAIARTKTDDVEGAITALSKIRDLDEVITIVTDLRED